MLLRFMVIYPRYPPVNVPTDLCFSTDHIKSIPESATSGKPIHKRRWFPTGRAALISNFRPVDLRHRSTALSVSGFSFATNSISVFVPRVSCPSGGSFNSVLAETDRTSAVAIGMWRSLSHPDTLISVMSMSRCFIMFLSICKPMSLWRGFSVIRLFIDGVGRAPGRDGCGDH